MLSVRGANSLQFRVTNTVKPGLGKRLEQHFLRQLRSVVDSTKQTFETITDNWDNQPKFSASIVQHGATITMSVLTDSLIFHWVDQGTEPHRIPSSGNRRMAFSESYSPRTAPGRFQFNQGGGVGEGETVFAYSVGHPGIEARNFTGRVRTQMQKEAVKVLGTALRTLPR